MPEGRTNAMKATRLVSATVFGIVLGATGHAIVTGQQLPGLKSTPLVRTDVAGVEGKEVLMAVFELEPGASIPRHFHHGQEFVYILEGTGSTDVEGQTTAHVKAGDHLYRPFRVPHDFKNTSSTPLRTVSILVVDKGKPLVVPVK
jgi:quercetin dioxygenase-like cupin family protein